MTPVDYTLDDVDRIGAAIAAVLRVGDVIGLSGDLGAGKTTLARAILKSLGLVGEAPSPSFAIVQPYASPEVLFPVWHIDLYRIDDPTEIDELALDEGRDEAALLIEWPERLGSRRWPDMLELSIVATDDDRRRLTVALPAAWEGRWPFPI
jgi:tRNA threonylcarbamoyladenosine biosynthesis protein TsaE